MSKAKEEFYESKKWCAIHTDAQTYIKELEQDKKEMLDCLIEYVSWGPMTQSDKYLHEEKFKKLIEKITELPIEEALNEKNNN